MKQVVKTMPKSEICISQIRCSRDYPYGIWIVRNQTIQKVNQLDYEGRNEIVFGTNGIDGGVYSQTRKNLHSLLEYHVDGSSIFIPETKAELINLLDKYLT